MNWLFASGGQSIGASASVLSMYIQGLFPLGLIGLNSLQSKGLSRVFSSTTIQKHQFFGAQPSFVPTLTSIHDYWKNHSFDYMDLCQQDDVFVFWYIALVFHNFPSEEQTSFNFVAAVIIYSDFGAQENKICHCFYFLLFHLPWNDETRCHDLQFFEYWVLSQVSHSPFSLSSRGSLLSAIRVVSLAYLKKSVPGEEEERRFHMMIRLS